MRGEYTVGMSGVYRCECGAEMVSLKALDEAGNVIYEIPLICTNRRHATPSWLCSVRKGLSKYVKDPVKREELFHLLLLLLHTGGEVWFTPLDYISVSLRKERERQT